jgi:hypothetical protein
MNIINAINKSLDARSKRITETRPPIRNNTRYWKRLVTLSKW